jgi:hypothetical protein
MCVVCFDAPKEYVIVPPASLTLSPSLTVAPPVPQLTLRVHLRPASLTVSPSLTVAPPVPQLPLRVHLRPAAAVQRVLPPRIARAACPHGAAQRRRLFKKDLKAYQ